MSWAICSCLAASCATLRRTTSKLYTSGSNCWIVSGAAATRVGGDFGGDSNQPSDWSWPTTMSLAVLS